MNEKWIQKGNAQNLLEYVKSIHEEGFQEFVTKSKKYEIKRMNEIAEVLKQASATKTKVKIVGDYDCDGITSLLNMTLICRYLQIPFELIIPKRFSEGYGLSDKIIDRLDDGGILITIDNGITAIDTIKKAKERGMYVIVIDHHVPLSVLPEADIIVDPHAIEGSADFDDYCGAGLAFKLAEYLIPKDSQIYAYINVFAMIGTVGDVVSLTEDNRQIVQAGLKYLQLGSCTNGLKALLTALNKTSDITSETIAYYLSPAINAPGRLEDDGGKKVLSLLISDRAGVPTDEVIALNEKRKTISKDVMEQINFEDFATDTGICYFNPTIPEGLAGIIAGKIAEATKKSTFVFTEVENNMAKGSGRNNAPYNIHLKKFLDEQSDLLAKYGGHKDAAGLSLPKDNIKALQQKLNEATKDQVIDNSIYYDLELKAEDVATTYYQMQLLEPFGEGNRKPMVRIKAQLGNKFGDKYRILGEEKKHIKFMFRDFDAIAFGMAEKFDTDATEIDMIGYLDKNVFKEKETIQVLITDFC